MADKIYACCDNPCCVLCNGTGTVTEPKVIQMIEWCESRKAEGLNPSVLIDRMEEYLEERNSPTPEEVEERMKEEEKRWFGDIDSSLYAGYDDRDKPQAKKEKQPVLYLYIEIAADQYDQLVEDWEEGKLDHLGILDIRFIKTNREPPEDESAGRYGD